jgi:hypothetical protein
VHDRNAESLGELVAIADLDGQPFGRLVDHGLTVEADHGDVARLDALIGKQPLDHLGVGPRGQLLGLRHHAGPRGAIRQRHRLGQGMPKQGPLLVAIGPV